MKYVDDKTICEYDAISSLLRMGYYKHHIPFLAKELQEQIPTVPEDFVFRSWIGVPRFNLKTNTPYIKFNPWYCLDQIPYETLVEYDDCYLNYDGSELHKEFTVERAGVMIEVQAKAPIPDDVLLTLKACGKIKEYYNEGYFTTNAMC